MKVEILYEDNKYWYATIVANFGQLLSLEWCGSSETFFHDVKRNNLYQIGTAAKVAAARILDSTPIPGQSVRDSEQSETNISVEGPRKDESKESECKESESKESECKESEDITQEESELKKLLQECAEAAKVSTEKSQVVSRMPPESLDLTEKEVEEVIAEIDSIGTETLPVAGFSPDLFREGMTLAVDLVHCPTKKWLATVIKNVGGRLLLRWLLPASPQCSDQPMVQTKLEDFWLFFCHPRIHIPQQDIEITFHPPIMFDDWASFLKETFIHSQVEEGEKTGCDRTVVKGEGVREETLRQVFLKRCKERRPQLLESNCIKNVKDGDKVLLFPSDLLRLVPATVEEKIQDFLRIKCDVPIECLLPDTVPTPPYVPGTPTKKDTAALTDFQGTSADCQGKSADSQDSQDTDPESTPKESNLRDIVPKEGDIVPKVEATLTEFAFIYPIEDTHAILPFNWTEENEIPLELGIDHMDIGSYLKVNNTRAAPIKLKSNDSMIKVMAAKLRMVINTFPPFP